MNIEVNSNYLNAISQEMREYAGQTAGLLEGLEEVEKELRKQSSLRFCLRNLGKVRDDIADDKYKLNVLAQALANIGTLYRKAEWKIEDDFEEKRPERNRSRAGNVDLSQLKDKVNYLLYGGENG